MINRRIRIAAWVSILALAAFQAYGERYAVSPDGISYLDLSDAVVTGRLGDIVNLYWSPLYPFLIGVARAITGAGPRTEVAVVHAVNFVAFVGLFAAFEYLLIELLRLSATRRRTALRGNWGAACAYLLFGTTFITMNPLELTTPDVLSNAAILLTLGALIRIHRGTTPLRAPAVVMGVALGAGMLAKSFLVPWAIVCFVVLAIDLRGRSSRPFFVAAGLWALFVVPWTALLSARAGRVTFGDAGRLTYIWYVNNMEAPSAKFVPPGARLYETEAIFPGVAVVDSAPGTDPMWFDPARWNAILRPRLSLHDQTKTLQVMTVALIANIAVLLFIVFPVVAAPPGTRRQTWRDVWVILVPCLAGVGAYCMVIVTARYIIAFVAGLILALLASLRIPTRIRPTFVMLAVFATVLPMAIDRLDRPAFSLGNAVIAAMLVGVYVRIERHILWMVSVPLAMIVALIAISPSAVPLMRASAAAITLGLWVGSRRAMRDRAMNRFAFSLYAALALGVALIYVGRLGLRIIRDANAASNAGATSPEWKIAQDLRAHGVPEGAHIALIGPHAESYWARTARVKIAANVPDPIAPIWWLIRPGQRDSLMTIFAQHGATFAIATRPPAPPGHIDSTWTPLKYGGWMKRLSP